VFTSATRARIIALDGCGSCRHLAKARLARIVGIVLQRILVNRSLAIFIGIVLGALAGVVLAMSILIDASRVLGPSLVWIEPYFRLGGVALGGLILAAAFLVIGIGVGRWGRPVTIHRRRNEEVRW